MKKSWILILLLLSGIACNAQILRTKNNQYDDDRNRHGKWVEYWDKNQKDISGRGRYIHGKPTGKWLYFHYNGQRRLKCKYKKANTLTIKYYDIFGQIEQKGNARIEFNEEGIHYFWEGKWKFYDTRHKIIRVSEFSKGEESRIIFSLEEE